MLPCSRAQNNYPGTPLCGTEGEVLRVDLGVDCQISDRLQQIHAGRQEERWNHLYGGKDLRRGQDRGVPALASSKWDLPEQ